MQLVSPHENVLQFPAKVTGKVCEPVDTHTHTRTQKGTKSKQFLFECETAAV